MSITYEDALATLEAMFGAPWTRDTLDAVLRHEKGHMENTCERILDHGSQDPQLLIRKLKDSKADPQVLSDEAIARQMQGGTGSSAGSAAGKPRRGAPTELPPDFLRIPGYKHRSMEVQSQGVAASGAMDDETLARMLQDELFSEELARNPDFAHLARGGRGGRGNQRTRSTAGRAGAPGQRRAGASNAQPPMQNPFENVNVMENLSKLGESTRKRLQMFAVNFENRLNNAGLGSGVSQRTGNVGLKENQGAVAERRGLLDDDFEEEIEFEMHEKKAK